MQPDITVPSGQTQEQKLLWEMYRGWTYHAAEYATTEDLRDMLLFYEQLSETLGKALPEDLKPNVILNLLTELLKPRMVFRVHHQNTEGKAHKDYFDFLFIMPATNHTQFSEYELLLELLTSNAPNTGCSVIKEEFLQRAIRDGYPYLTWACSRANLVYADGAPEVPAINYEMVAGMIDRAASEFRIGHHRAKSFLTSAETHLKEDDLAMVMFNIHQAIELSYRAVIGSLLGVDKNIHSIRLLKKHLRKVAPQLTFILPDNAEKEIQLMNLLERAHNDARFKSEYQVDRADVKTLLNRALTIHKDSEKIFSKQIKFFVASHSERTHAS